MANTLVCIVGPTAIGKTVQGIELARALDTVILSADSRQFYREMNVGTAKPSSAELATVPHYFIDSHQVTEGYSAGDFEREALALLADLFASHDVVVLVGGSGLFIDALCHGLDNLPKPSPGIRDRLNTLHGDRGLTYLQEMLKDVDPVYYGEVDIHNPQRVIRALEIYESTGKPFSHFRRKQEVVRPFQVLKIGLNTDRELLYQRINARVDAMMEQGLLEEVKSLLPYRALSPLQTVGYSELFDYLDGHCSFEEAIRRIKQNTRRYAKRQLTWFKKDTSTTWFEPHETSAIIRFVKDAII